MDDGIILEQKRGMLRGIASKRCDDFSCLNCLHCFTTKNNLESHQKLREKRDFCFIIMPGEAKILEFYQSQKSHKAPLVIYADLECLIGKNDGCKPIVKIHSQQK